jgi:hypothetical protein
MQPLRAGAVYVLVIFIAGFVLGTFRVLVLAPSVGEGAALALEIPLMLTLSWIAAGHIISWMNLPALLGARLGMGGFAFALLMLAELGVSLWLFDRSLAEHLAYYRTMPGAVGLAAQVGFAAIPLLRLGRGA